MRHFFNLALCLLSLAGFSQSSSTLSGSQTNPPLDDHLQLEQYLWGYTKNNLGKNEKSAIDFKTIDNWRELGNYLSVSDNGKYFAYTINKPTGTRYWFRRLDSLIIQSTRNGWRSAFGGSKPGFFTANGEQYIFQNGESLCFLQLGKPHPRYVKNIVSYKVSQHGKAEWLAYQLNNNNDTNLILHNLVTGKEVPFFGVTDYNFDNRGELLACQINSNNNGGTNELLLYNLATGLKKQYSYVADYLFAGREKVLLLKVIEKTDKGIITSLKYLDYTDKKEKILWSTNKEEAVIDNYSIDNSGRQVVFSVRDSTGTSIWYYEVGTDKAIMKVTNNSPGIAEGLIITGAVSFSDNGRYIKFSLQSPPYTIKPDAAMAQVEVWNHKDLYLQSVQAELSKLPKVYNAIINIENGKVILLESNGKKLYIMHEDFAVVKKYPTEEHGDRFWEAGDGIYEDSNWIVSLKEGSSQVLPTKAGNGNIWFSPDGKYLVYFDVEKSCHYFSYNLYNKVLKDISANVPKDQLGFVDRYQRNEGYPKSPAGIAAWLPNDTGVLVYDNFDIWRLDLTGTAPAVDVTNGFGYSNSTILSLLITQRSYNDNIPVLQPNESLVLRAFNIRNKQSGFYQKTDVTESIPKLLYMGGYFMKFINGCQDPNLSNEGLAPVKAKSQNIWIVQRQSDIDAPNYYETKDFKNFSKLTNFKPQQNFRWISEELHSFRHLDGREGQGILYKPDDFDQTKKYPVLIVLYGAFSDNLYQFPVPSYIDEGIAPGRSPVWFLNNGYLVFTPDIYTTSLKYGPSAFNVIEGAVQYLKTLPYVDGNKLGCSTHSWSAKLGAYIFTHSKSIAANVISEGMLYADAINHAFSARDGRSRLADVERGLEYGNLWENKEAWLDQTTVLQVDKAQSPLLLLCNKQSTADYQDQTYQFFNALRRLDKNVWWLKYDNGAHTLQDLKELKDYTIRYTQFLDHYLKEAPAPLWMTQGVPLKLKGVESGFELDAKGNCGRDCKVCKKWNEQYKKHREMFNKPIREWHLE